MESGEPSGLLSLTHTYTHVQTRQGESLKEIHTYRGTHVYIPQKRWTHGYACAGRKQHRLTAAEHIWSCDPGTRKWVVFLREQGKRWGRGLFFYDPFMLPEYQNREELAKVRGRIPYSNAERCSPPGARVRD